MQGEAPGAGFSGLPYIAADNQPIRFESLSAADRDAFERRQQSFEEDRQARIEARKDARLSGRNSFGGMTAECIVRTAIIFSPLCIFIVPSTYGVASAVEGRKAARQEPYMPDLPSDRELAIVGERITRQLTATGIANWIVGATPPERDGAPDGGFPRLLLRAGSATFTPDGIITVTVIAQGQPQAGVVWAATHHRYHFAYAGDVDGLASRLSEAETSIATSIASMYRLQVRPRAAPGATSTR